MDLSGLLRWKGRSGFVYKQKTTRFPGKPRAAGVRRVAATSRPEPPDRRPRISREYLEEYRRRRYVDAVAELLHEFGRAGASVIDIVRLAGTARNSFYEVFVNAEDCIAYGIGVAVTEVFEVVDGQDGAGEWVADVERAIAGFYGVVAAEPLLAELFLIHAAASRVEDGREATRRGAEALAPLFARGREEAESRGLRPPPEPAAEFFSLAALSPAARRVRGPEVARLVAEARPMAALVVGAYLGPEAADELLGRPAPARL
jgi:AcrR family transcriptional regulator